MKLLDQLSPEHQCNKAHICNLHISNKCTGPHIKEALHHKVMFKVTLGHLLQFLHLLSKVTIRARCIPPTFRLRPHINLPTINRDLLIILRTKTNIQDLTIPRHTKIQTRTSKTKWHVHPNKPHSIVPLHPSPTLPPSHLHRHLFNTEE